MLQISCFRLTKRLVSIIVGKKMEGKRLQTSVIPRYSEIQLSSHQT